MKTNWIAKINDFVHTAIKKKNVIRTCDYGYGLFQFIVEKDGNNYILITYSEPDHYVYLKTPKGELYDFECSFTPREMLELKSLVLRVQEYEEEMANSELEEFIKLNLDEIKTINDIDYED